MSHGRKPTAHKTRLLDPQAFMEWMGLRRERSNRNMRKSGRRQHARLDFNRDKSRSRATRRVHRLHRRYR